MAQPAEAKRLDRYEVLAELASGGMATVFLGRLAGAGGFERLVAIKRLHPHLERDESFVQMFLDEARIAARIHHPNVVSTLEIGAAERGYFLVMDYVEGTTLARLLGRGAQLGERVPIRVALRIVVDALNGLHAAHELRDETGASLALVHRDVSPQNVLIGVDGTSRITDFGVARAMSRLSHTRTGQLKGKLGYMAPEQARGEEVDRRADLFAAGVLLWETLAGKRLFKGKSDTDAETLTRVLSGDIPSVRAANPTVPAAIDAVLAKALERDAGTRFATALEFVDALEAAAGADLGSARDVAKYLEQTVGPEIAQKKDAIRSLGATPMVDAGTLTDVPRLVPSSVSSSTLSVPNGLPSGPVSVVVQHAPPKTAHSVVIGVLAGALVVALGGLGLVLYLRAPAPPAAPAGVAASPAASVPVAPVAATAAPAAAASAEPSAAASAGASASASAAASAAVAPGAVPGGPARGGAVVGPAVVKPKGGSDGLSTNPYR